MLLREATPIGPEETTGQLHDRLSAMGARLIVDALARLDDLVPHVQPQDGVTYAAKIDKAEAAVDWTRPATQVDRLIRGLSPFPGAWVEAGGQRIKLLASRLAAGAGAPGAVQLLRLQRAGRGAQDAAEFLRGQPLPKGTRL